MIASGMNIKRLLLLQLFRKTCRGLGFKTKEKEFVAVSMAAQLMHW